MNLAEARKLIYGNRVLCPADRGTPAFVGTVRSNDCLTMPASPGTYGKFIWVSVQEDKRGRRTVWPSNRLERI